MTGLVVVGAGGHGREVADVAQACGLEVRGFVDDGSPDTDLLCRRGLSLLGTTDVLREGEPVVLGLGDGAARRSLTERLEHVVWTHALVHPRASLGTDVELQPGTVVAAGARLTTNIRLGRHVYVGPNACLGHDARLDDFVTVLPGATISGSVHVATGATVGTGANVLQGLVIGEGAVVGAGAVVTRSVPSGMTVVGIPARVV